MLGFGDFVDVIMYIVKHVKEYINDCLREVFAIQGVIKKNVSDYFCLAL